jgi:transcriptional regulator GlxA family with amidase domain
MATNDERHAAQILTLLEQAPGRQLSSAQLAEQTGWSPDELSAAKPRHDFVALRHFW